VCSRWQVCVCLCACARLLPGRAAPNLHDPVVLLGISANPCCLSPNPLSPWVVVPAQVCPRSRSWCRSHPSPASPNTCRASSMPRAPGRLRPPRWPPCRPWRCLLIYRCVQRFMLAVNRRPWLQLHRAKGCRAAWLLRESMPASMRMYVSQTVPCLSHCVLCKRPMASGAPESGLHGGLPPPAPFHVRVGPSGPAQRAGNEQAVRAVWHQLGPIPLVGRLSKPSGAGLDIVLTPCRGYRCFCWQVLMHCGTVRR